MMKEIFHIAELAGYPQNSCIVCHGGNPEATTKEEAHKGSIKAFLEGLKTDHGIIKGAQNFYPDPGSPWINKYTCGMCHQEQVRTQYTSLMFTEAGKIQGTLWGFGGLNGYKHDIGNYDVKTLDIHETLGTKQYKKYMEELKKTRTTGFSKKNDYITKSTNCKRS